MKVIRNLGVVGGLCLATAVHAQAPTVQRARDNAERSEAASEQRAGTAGKASEDSYGGAEGGGEAPAGGKRGKGGGGGSADDTTQAADRAAADEGGGGGGGEPAPEEYTVVPGDTLWDLCERFMQNPFYWPKIWSINPHIENAHWIYPGNIIKFYAGGDGAAGGEGGEGGEGGGAGGGDNAAAGGEGGEGGAGGSGGGEGGEGGGGRKSARGGGEGGEGGAGGEGGGEGGGAGGGDEFSNPDQMAAGEGGGGGGGEGDQGFDAQDAISTGGEVPRESLFDGAQMTQLYQAILSKSGKSRHLTAFISKKELEKAGEISASLAEETYLTQFQTVLLATKNKPQRGDKFQIFKSTRDIKHPTRPGPLGSMVEILGLVEVTEVEGGKARGVIREAYGPIERGDRITPFAEWNPSVEPKANEKEVKAVVADTYEEYTTVLGEYHLVFLDKGKSDGVQPGNTFDIMRTEDSMTGAKFSPDDVVGSILVLDAKDGVSTGVITSSRVEIMVGDRAEMRPKKATN